MMLLPCNFLFQIRKIVAIILSVLETTVLMSAISHEFIKFLIPTALCVVEYALVHGMLEGNFHLMT